jgi:PIN domain nuclease of toxin-antitoxin system
MMVFDSSALLAWHFREPGMEFVDELLSEADTPKYLHAANEAEVLSKVAQRHDFVAALAALRSMQAMGVRTLHDMDAAFIEDVAAIKADWTVALGDCFGVALCRRLGADFITADRGEMGKIKAAGVCAVTFIR